MAMSMTVNLSASIAGKTFAQQKSITAEEGRVKEISVPTAKAGTLTTRTDNDTGTITMSSGGHGITTGANVDLYWTGGSRRGVTVGTVSGTSVPIDLGAGDNLPIATTVINVAVVQTESLVFTGTTVVGFAMYTPKKGTIVLRSSGAEEYFRVLEDGGVDLWFSGNGVTNPITGDSVITVNFSHGDTAAAQLMRFGVLTDS